jgi:hypothetical protein
MTTITSTGNFYRRPTKSAEIGFVVGYHFHNFDHTVIPLAGLWRVQQYEWVEGEDAPDPAKFLGEVLVASKLFTPPGVEVSPWIVIQKARWHRLELVSKTAYLVGGATVECAEGEFWCCFSLRDYTGEVTEFDTGWRGINV